VEAWNLISLAGIPILLAIAWLFSADRRRLPGPGGRHPGLNDDRCYRRRSLHQYLESS